ncbi:hypothetical protein [Chitinivorax sp. B]|uniref:hypothetical protein n=1 Tax=Chitinivorax sp. B TaxID=2502235 RepID=UPI0010F960A3|nr:hypothetical protein [Chitinivorax sp. B]
MKPAIITLALTLSLASGPAPAQAVSKQHTAKANTGSAAISSLKARQTRLAGVKTNTPQTLASARPGNAAIAESPPAHQTRPIAPPPPRLPPEQVVNTWAPYSFP